MSLPEFQREEVIAEREAEKAKVDQKRQLDNMYKNRQGEDTVAKAAKRELSFLSRSAFETRVCPPKVEKLTALDHAWSLRSTHSHWNVVDQDKEAGGAEEQSSGEEGEAVEKGSSSSFSFLLSLLVGLVLTHVDPLRLSQGGSGNSPRRRAAASDSSDEEDGGVSRYSEDEAERRTKKASEQIELHDLERARLSRGDLASKVDNPAFEEYVTGESFFLSSLSSFSFETKDASESDLSSSPLCFDLKGGFVRYVVGPGDQGQPVYRVFEVVGEFCLSLSLSLVGS